MNTPIDITGVTLTTPRLILRPWRLEDAEDFYAYTQPFCERHRRGYETVRYRKS